MNAARLARYAARLSLTAPFAGAFIFLILQWSGLNVAETGWQSGVGFSLAISALVLPVFGLILGTIALLAAKRYGRTGIFGMAIAGTALCGIYILFLVLICVVAAAVRHEPH